MRAWRVTTPEELSTWLRNRGFPATRPGQHLSVRVQEFIFHEGCVLDARVAMLETAFVSVTLEQGRASGALNKSWNKLVVVQTYSEASRSCILLDSDALPEGALRKHFVNNVRSNCTGLSGTNSITSWGMSMPLTWGRLPCNSANVSNVFGARSAPVNS